MKNHDLSYVKRRTKLRISKLWREFTHQQRVLPDFIIIGAQKAGTTSLHKYLRQHPSVVSSFKKEVKYFDCNFGKGINWYRSHFPYASEMSLPHAITGEASPHYILHPLTPKRISEVLPDVKLIALLRNPVTRAHSHFQLNVRRGREKLSFEEAIEQEPRRLEGIVDRIIAGEEVPLFNFLHYTYLAKGIYIDQLQNWFKYFPREQMLIIKSEDFFTDPPAVFKQVLEFLGLPEWELEKYTRYNTGEYSAMEPATRQRLAEYFRPHNQRLYEYLGVDFGWENG